MSATFKLPPSERDFEVFFKVAFYSVSTRETAEIHNISQTRVRQLVTLVGAQAWKLARPADPRSV